MASSVKPADVFIGYSRRDTDAWPLIFSKLLDRKSDYARFMQLRICFFDDRLEAGDDWSDELENHAGGCEVFVAVIGPEWIKVLEERAETEDGVQITIDERVKTDWVYKELVLALDREEPASVQIVCVNGATFESIDANRLFPPGRVREYFKSPVQQILNYRGTLEDDHKFCNAVRNLLESQNVSRLTAASAPQKKPALFDNVDPWLRFINRRNVWELLKSDFGMGMPLEASFAVGAQDSKSIALLISYNDEGDRPRELIRAISHHMYVKGEFSTFEDTAKSEKSSDEHWYRLNTFNWPVKGTLADVYRAVFNTFKLESDSAAMTFSDPQKEFVPALVAQYRDQRLSPCIYAALRNPGKKDLKLARAFVQSWNQLDWSGLPEKLVFMIGIRAPDKKIVKIVKPDASVSLQPIGLITSNCISDWIEEFLEIKLGVDNIQPKPVWLAQVKNYRRDGSADLSYADLETEFGGLV